MDTTPTDLMKDLDSITETFAQLSQRLSDVADQVRTQGIPPAEGLLEELAASRRNFTELRDRAIELAGLLAAVPTKAPEEISSIKELEALLQSVAEAQAKKATDDKLRERALTVLDRILSLTHRDLQEFAPLIECQAKARGLRNTLLALSGPDLHPDTAALAQGRHPFAELLTLIEGHDDLEDDLWLLLKHAVAEGFGKSLALGAARGKLLLGDRPNGTANGQVPALLATEGVLSVAFTDGEIDSTNADTTSTVA